MKLFIIPFATTVATASLSLVSAAPAKAATTFDDPITAAVVATTEHHGGTGTGTVLSNLNNKKDDNGMTVSSQPPPNREHVQRLLGPVALEEFEEQNWLKKNLPLDFQYMGGGDTMQKTLRAAGKVFDLNRALPIDHSRTVCIHDGVKDDSCRQSLVHRGVNDDGDIFIVLYDHKTGKVAEVTILLTTGETIELINVHEDIYATITEDDFDPDKIEAFHKHLLTNDGDKNKIPFPPENDPNGDLLLRGRTMTEVDATSNFRANNKNLSSSSNPFDNALKGRSSDGQQQQEGRNLQLREPCTEYNPLEVAIAYDYTFCARFGFDSVAADAKVDQLIDYVSGRYELDGMCIKVYLVELDSNCDFNTDPFREMTDLTIFPSCGRSLLDFGRLWQGERGRENADAIHLFTGNRVDTGSAVGCAWIRSWCSDFQYGVNYIFTSTNLFFQGQLVTHELGHNGGAQHDSSSTSFIMYPSLTGATTWSDATLTSIRGNVDNLQCMEICESNADCDDGVACNGIETCDTATGLCSRPAEVDCQDGSFCNGVEFCDTQSDQCEQQFLVGSDYCDDGNSCNGVETCNEGPDTCTPGIWVCPTTSATVNPGNGAGAAGPGFFFDLEAKDHADVEVVSIQVQASSAGTMQVFTFDPSALGRTTSSIGWTQVLSTPVAGGAVVLSFNPPIVIPAGASIGMHIYSTGFINFLFYSEPFYSKNEEASTFDLDVSRSIVVPDLWTESVYSTSTYDPSNMIVTYEIVPVTPPDTSSPSEAPSSKPSSLPSLEPTSKPSQPPSGVPSPAPSSKPSEAPSEKPTMEGEQPSAAPSRSPEPSSAPSTEPSGKPSSRPSATPSLSPSAQPSSSPTPNPSAAPSPVPSSNPSAEPSGKPSAVPSADPTKSVPPSLFPSAIPSENPTIASAACADQSQYTCAYVDGGGDGIVSGYVSICLFNLQRGTFSSRCLSKDRVGDAEPGDVYRNRFRVEKCGCCEGDELDGTPEYCDYEPIPCDVETYNCGDSNVDGFNQGPIYEVDFCYFDTSLNTLVKTCEQPFTNLDAGDEFRGCGTDCVLGDEPSVTPSVVPSAVPTKSSSPSVKPTTTPSTKPSPAPSSSPSTKPSQLPSGLPTMIPSSPPSNKPSPVPSSSPSTMPRQPPSGLPTMRPSSPPSNKPSPVPSSTPTMKPSSAPSDKPSAEGTSPPTTVPSDQPSDRPSFAPSSAPSSKPSPKASLPPTSMPSAVPSNQPSSRPSFVPSDMPTPEASSPPTSLPSVTVTASTDVCDATDANVCGVVYDDVNDEFVNEFYSVCIYQHDRNRYRHRCYSKSESPFLLEVGTYVNSDDEIVECGCCSDASQPSGRVPAYCNIDSSQSNPLDCLADTDNYCGDDNNGEAEVRYCYFDASRRRERNRCRDPYDQIPSEDTFLGCATDCL